MEKRSLSLNESPIFAALTDDERVAAISRYADAANAYDVARSAKQYAAAVKEQARDSLVAFLTEYNTESVHQHDFLVRIKMVKSITLNADRLKADLPEVYAKYSVPVARETIEVQANKMAKVRQAARKLGSGA